jgi:hypothetical protein
MKKLVWIHQLKKNANDDVIDMIILIDTTGELNFGCIQLTPLGSIFKSPSICRIRN